MSQIRLWCRNFLVLSSLMFAMATTAQVDVFDFETAEQEERFRQLANDFRCPMCQNANLTHSTGGVAADLRREIYNQILEGRTDEEIEQFMLQRYGDFILYRPRLTVKTILLWFGPALFLIIGLWVAFGIIKRSASPNRNNDESTNSKSLRRRQQDQKTLLRMNRPGWTGCCLTDWPVTLRQVMTHLMIPDVNRERWPFVLGDLYIAARFGIRFYCRACRPSARNSTKRQAAASCCQSRYLSGETGRTAHGSA